MDDTAKQLKLDDVISTVKSDVIKYLDKEAVKKFDIIFADPPYDLDEETYNKIPDLVLLNNWLEEGGNFILEHPSNFSFENHPRFVQHKKYGNVHFSFCE